MDQGLGELEKIERNIDAVREVESLYLAVLFYGFFPPVLLSVSFSLARGWDASVLIALAFGIGAFWSAQLVYIALLSIELYLAMKRAFLIGKTTRQDALTIALLVLLISLLSLVSVLSLKVLGLGP
jgi:hypothetical protein